MPIANADFECRGSPSGSAPCCYLMYVDNAPREAPSNEICPNSGAGGYSRGANSYRLWAKKTQGHTGTSVLLTPSPSGITSSPQYESDAHWAASNALADGDHCAWSAGAQVALAAADKNFIQIDLERDHTIDKVRGLDVSNLWHHALYNNFQHGAADIYVCRTAGSGLTAGDCSKCDGVISNTIGSYYDRTCGGLRGRYVRVEFLASNGLFANIHFCRLRIFGWEHTVLTQSPTGAPSSGPTLTPSMLPTLEPTYNPSENPTSNPTPSMLPTTFPTTTIPTSNPSFQPTHFPTVNPTSNPSLQPSTSPTTSPATSPTRSPTTNPAHFPSSSPTTNPSSQPTTSPIGLQSVGESDWVKSDMFATFSSGTGLFIAGCAFICCAGVSLFLCRGVFVRTKLGKHLAMETKHAPTICAEGYAPSAETDYEHGGSPNLDRIWEGSLTGGSILSIGCSDDNDHSGLYVSEQQLEGRSQTKH